MHGDKIMHVAPQFVFISITHVLDGSFLYFLTGEHAWHLSSVKKYRQITSQFCKEIQTNYISVLQRNTDKFILCTNAPVWELNHKRDFTTKYTYTSIPLLCLVILNLIAEFPGWGVGGWRGPATFFAYSGSFLYRETLLGITCHSQCSTICLVTLVCLCCHLVKFRSSSAANIPSARA